jgi:hypothetical protein
MLILILILGLCFIYFLIKYFKLKKLNKNRKPELFCCMPNEVKLKDGSNVLVRINFEYIIIDKGAFEESFKSFETFEVLLFHFLRKYVKDKYDIKEFENRKEDIKSHLFDNLSKFECNSSTT